MLDIVHIHTHHNISPSVLLGQSNFCLKKLIVIERTFFTSVAVTYVHMTNYVHGVCVCVSKQKLSPPFLDISLLVHAGGDSDTSQCSLRIDFVIASCTNGIIIT